MIRKLAGGALALSLLALAAGTASRPVLSDTLTWADAQFAAITARISGVAGGSGTAAAPAYAFPADTSTGLFRPGAGILGVSSAGTEQMRVGPLYTSVQIGTRWGYNTATDTFTANGMAVPNYGFAVGGSIGGGGGMHVSGYYGVAFYRAGGEVWRMSPDLLPSADNTFSIGSAGQRVKTVFGLTLNLTGLTAPTSSSDASGAVGDLRIVGNTLYWKTSSGWVRSAGTTF